jgi:hypothetical protein
VSPELRSPSFQSVIETVVSLCACLVALHGETKWKYVWWESNMTAEVVMDAHRELDLVKRAQEGDRDAYGRLVDLYGGVVLAIAYSRVGN